MTFSVTGARRPVLLIVSGWPRRGRGQVRSTRRRTRRSLMSANRPTSGVDDDPLELVRRNVESPKPLCHAFEFRERRLGGRVFRDHGRLMKATGAIDIRLDD